MKAKTFLFWLLPCLTMLMVSCLGGGDKSLLDADMADKDTLFPVRENGKWGFIDPEGNLVIPLQYDGAGLFYDGRAGVIVGDKYGYIDKAGNYVIEPQFELSGNFQEGLR